MKRILDSIFLLAIGFVTRQLAVWAEFGNQMTYTGLSAAADLSNKQYVAVRFAGAGLTNQVSEVLKAGAQTGPIGILQNKPKSGEAANVAFLGLSKAFGGGTITAGAVIASTVSGTIVNAVSGDTALGRAMETATTHGEIVTVMLFPPVIWGGTVA